MTEKIDPENLADRLIAEQSAEEEMDAVEFIAAAISEMLEKGVPVRFFKDANLVLGPLSARVQRQNEILADISASARAIAKKMGVLGLADKTVSADLNQK